MGKLNDFFFLPRVWACVLEAFHRDLWPGRVLGFRPRGEQEGGVFTTSTAAGSASVPRHCPLLSQLPHLTLHRVWPGGADYPVRRSFWWRFRRAELFPSSGVAALMTEALRGRSSSHTPLCLPDRILIYSFGVGQGITYLYVGGLGAVPTMASDLSTGGCGGL